MLGCTFGWIIECRPIESDRKYRPTANSSQEDGLGYWASTLTNRRKIISSQFRT